MSEKAETVPDLLVERLVLGDLDAKEEADVRARLAAAGEGERVAALERANRLFLAVHPATAAWAEVERRLRERPGNQTTALPRRRHRVLLPSLALAAAAALAIVVARPRPTPTPERDEIITVKGLRPHLVIYKKTPAGPARLDDSSRVHPGDTLQVAYVGAGRRFGMVVSQDARGQVTFHLPVGGGAAASLKDGGEIAAAHAFQLDDSPGFERFVFLTSDQPFGASAVFEALRADRKALPPPGTTVTEVVLTKEIP